MATHNGEKYLKEQIDSILVQLSSNDELIISDDGSNDQTIPIIESYNDQRLRLIYSPKKNSPILNFENSLNHSSGDRIFLSDQDDIWQPNKIQVMQKILHNSDLVLCDCTLVDDNLQLISPSLFELNKTKKGMFRNFIKNGYIGCCMAFRKTVLEKSLPFPDNIPMHDQWIGLVSEKHFRTMHIPDKLVQYRRHESTITKTGVRSHNSLTSKLKFRYTLFSGLLKLGI